MSLTTSVPATRLMTAEDLFALGSDFHGELVRGKIIEMAPAGGLHGFVAVNVAIIVGNYVRREKLGVCFVAETGFTIERSPDTVRAPDFAYARNGRLPNNRVEVAFLDGTPDLGCRSALAEQHR